MILDLGGTWAAIRVTAEYSNALLVATLPYFSDYAKKLELPVPHPITVTDVAAFKVVPIRDLGVSIGVKGSNGIWALWCTSRHMNGFRGPHSYFALQDPDEIPKYYGAVRLSKEAAVELARSTIRKLGIPLESVWAEQEPRVTPPPRIGTNVVPHYRITWIDPAGGSDAVDVDVNGQTKRVERFHMSLAATRQSMPKISLKTSVDPPVERQWPPTNPEYAWKLIPIVLPAIDEYAKILALPVARPLTTNHVARFELSDNGGWPHAEVELTNGWRFIYRNSMVNGFYAPDVFFSKYQKRILIKDFVGKWNLTEVQATALIRRTLSKLNYPTNHIHMDFKPHVATAAVNKENIPRWFFSWDYIAKKGDDVQSRIEAEVDADKGVLKSFYYDDKVYWRRPPPIDVPLSLPRPAETNSGVQRVAPRPRPDAPPRPLAPIKPERNLR